MGFFFFPLFFWVQVFLAFLVPLRTNICSSWGVLKQGSENPRLASRADITVQLQRDQYFIKMLLGNHYSLLKFMSRLQPTDLSGDDKRLTFGTAGLTLLIKCHRSHSSGALPMAGLCDSSAFYLFIFFFLQGRKTNKKSTASCANGPGGTFDFTVHYVWGTVSHFKWMRRPHGPAGLNFKFATCEDTRRAWQKADGAAIRAF